MVEFAGVNVDTNNSMVPAFGISLPHYSRDTISLSAKILELKFSFNSLVASIHKVAFANTRYCLVKLPSIQVRRPTSDYHKRVNWSKSLRTVIHSKFFCSEEKIVCIQFGLYKDSICRRLNWSIRNSADGSGLDPLINSGDGQTRLVKTFQSLLMKLNARIQVFKKDLPKKFLFFLVGFYCATAFATVIGQTGDWDILSAALAVVIVEGIGVLMYKASIPLVDRLKNLVVMFNYWKVGLTMGLFLDSFKY